MHHVIDALRRSARDERGFTMVTVMAVMLCVTLLSIAALATAQGDLKPGDHDKSARSPMAAAEAGVQNYLFHLAQDPNYWAKCTTGAGPHAINDPWNGVVAGGRPAHVAVSSRLAMRATRSSCCPPTARRRARSPTPDPTMIDAGIRHLQDPRDRTGPGGRRSSARSSRPSSARASWTTCTSPTRRRARRACTG